MEELRSLVRYHEELVRSYEEYARHINQTRLSMQQTIRMLDATYIRIMNIEHEFQGNSEARALIQSIQQQQPTQPTQPTQQQPPQPTQPIQESQRQPTSPSTQAMPNQWLGNLVGSLMADLLEQAITPSSSVRGATQEEIANASHTLRYSEIENPISEQCPISLETFEPDEWVIQLNHCGHIFRKELLDAWFVNNSHCPVCRHNIQTNANANINANTTRQIFGHSVNIEMNANQNLANNFIQQLYPGAQTTTSSWQYDAETNRFYFDTFILPNSTSS